MEVAQYTPSGDFGPGKLQWGLILLLPTYMTIDLIGEPGWALYFILGVPIFYLLAIGYNRVRGVEG